MLMLRHADKNRGKERKDIRLKERDEKLQHVQSERNENASERYAEPKNQLVRRRRYKAE